MKTYSKKLEFEEAQNLKEKIQLLKVYNNKSTVVNPKFKNIEVYGIIDDEKYVYVNYMKINNGRMLGGETIKLRKKIQGEKFFSVQKLFFTLRKTFSGSKFFLQIFAYFSQK